EIVVSVVDPMAAEIGEPVAGIEPHGGGVLDVDIQPDGAQALLPGQVHRGIEDEAGDPLPGALRQHAEGMDHQHLLRWSVDGPVGATITVRGVVVEHYCTDDPVVINTVAHDVQLPRDDPGSDELRAGVPHLMPPGIVDGGTQVVDDGAVDLLDRGDILGPGPGEGQGHGCLLGLALTPAARGTGNANGDVGRTAGAQCVRPWSG